MAKVEVLEDVPDSDLKRIIENFKREGAQVSTTRQDNSLWTVTATFSDE